jgi:hypothetical protein
VKSSGVKYPNILRFSYAARILNEFTTGETVYPILYNAAANSFSYLNLTYDLDEANNLKSLRTPTTNEVSANYLTNKGIFNYPVSQIAFHIHFGTFIRSYLGNYHPFIYVNAFADLEMANVTIRDTQYNLSTIRDASGNIVQTDVRNLAGAHIYRFAYTYESRVLN